MTAADFRRIALSLEGAEEGSHMGAADFRVGGRIFATLASEKQGYGNLMLTPEQQADFVQEQPNIFLAIAGGWGRMGSTHIRLAQANEEVLAGAVCAVEVGDRGSGGRVENAAPLIERHAGPVIRRAGMEPCVCRPCGITVFAGMRDGMEAPA